MFHEFSSFLWKSLTGIRQCLIQTLPIWNNQGHRLFTTGSNYHYLTNEFTLFQKALDQLGCDVFSVGQLEQIFLSIGDVKPALFVHVTNVARIKPSVFNHGGSCFRLTVISAHYVWTLNKYFS